MATAALIIGLIASGLGVAQSTAQFIQTVEAIHNHTTGAVYRTVNPKAARKYNNDKCWKRCQRMVK